ncbi:MAG: TfoX/Sxy family protein [Rickettsiales bacterium]|jgi:hypothetical protein|nr:TfoX/Sxy family protein [Rickettsiales bacterium]
MATNNDFINFVAEQVQDSGEITTKKMFGEYMLYCDGKPVFLVCDNTVFVKQLPEVLALFKQFDITPEIGEPYPGAKPHYVLDIENQDLSIEVAKLLARILPFPKPKNKSCQNKSRQ